MSRMSCQCTQTVHLTAVSNKLSHATKLLCDCCATQLQLAAGVLVAP